MVSDPSASHAITYYVYHTDKDGSTAGGERDKSHDVMRLVLPAGAFSYAIGPVASGFALCAGGPQSKEERRAVHHQLDAELHSAGSMCTAPASRRPCLILLCSHAAPASHACNACRMYLLLTGPCRSRARPSRS